MGRLTREASEAREELMPQVGRAAKPENRAAVLNAPEPPWPHPGWGPEPQGGGFLPVPGAGGAWVARAAGVGEAPWPQWGGCGRAAGTGAAAGPVLPAPRPDRRPGPDPRALPGPRRVRPGPATPRSVRPIPLRSRPRGGVAASPLHPPHRTRGLLPAAPRNLTAPRGMVKKVRSSHLFGMARMKKQNIKTDD